MILRIENDKLHIGPVQITFQRTLRIPDDGRSHPLPPGLGAFPLRRVADYADRVPPEWREHGGVLLPIYQREAMWLSFGGRWWKPNALKVAVGKVNAVSGKPWSEKLGADPQDYVVVPLQPWLDGINSGKDTIRQFVAMPLGMGYTVEGQVTGEETQGGLQLCVFDPVAGRFPDEPPPPPVTRLTRTAELADGAKLAMAAAGAPIPPRSAAPRAGAAMGLAAGGRMQQAIYPDPHGVDAWDQSNYKRVFVHLCNSQLWREITGEEPPPTPVTARAYSDAGLPWFDLYDEHLGDIDPAEQLAGVKSVKEMDAEKGFELQQDDDPIAEPKVKKLGAPEPGVIADGKW